MIPYILHTLVLITTEYTIRHDDVVRTHAGYHAYHTGILHTLVLITTEYTTRHDDVVRTHAGYHAYHTAGKGSIKASLQLRFFVALH